MKRTEFLVVPFCEFFFFSVIWLYLGNKLCLHFFTITYNTNITYTTDTSNNTNIIIYNTYITYNTYVSTKHFLQYNHYLHYDYKHYKYYRYSAYTTNNTNLTLHFTLILQATLTPLQKKMDCYSKQGSILPENILSLRCFERL